MMKDLLKKLQKKSNKKGFTLVEIIVVLVILAILAAIAVPSVIGYVDEAKESRYIQEARSIYVVIQTEEAKCAALNSGSFTQNAKNTVSDPVYDTNHKGTDLLKKQIAKTTTLSIKSVTATPKETTAPESTSSWVVEWKSDDGKGLRATISKNKDIKITKKNVDVTSGLTNPSDASDAE